MSCECTNDCEGSVVLVDTSEGPDQGPPDNGGPDDGGNPDIGGGCDCPETVVVTDTFDEPIFEAHDLT